MSEIQLKPVLKPVRVLSDMLWKTLYVLGFSAICIFLVEIMSVTSLIAIVIFLNPLFGIALAIVSPFTLFFLLMEWWDEGDDAYICVGLAFIYFVIKTAMMTITAFKCREDVLLEVLPLWYKLFIAILKSRL